MKNLLYILSSIILLGFSCRDHQEPKAITIIDKHEIEVLTFDDYRIFKKSLNAESKIFSYNAANVNFKNYKSSISETQSTKAISTAASEEKTLNNLNRNLNDEKKEEQHHPTLNFSFVDVKQNLAHEHSPLICFNIPMKVAVTNEP